MENYREEASLVRFELINLLNNYGIPIDSWGKDGAKTVDHLVDEINNKETVLVQNPETGTLTREFSFLAIVVLYIDGNNTYQLIEDRQVFTDGRERRRSSDISVGEKIKYNESNIEQAIARALSEELGIQGGFVAKEGEIVVEEADSKSYPGLKSHRVRYNSVVKISSEQYKPEGYVETQPDKTTYFIWKKI
jgi:hypothetical protein